MNKINLEETQWWSKTKLEKLQNVLLWNIIDHAYKKVPYYQRVFKERGLMPHDIKTKDDLQKLPILTKEEIRRHFKDLIYKPLCKRKPSLTSGSTGEPLEYFWDSGWDNIRWQSVYRWLSWAGYKDGQTIGVLLSIHYKGNDRFINISGDFSEPLESLYKRITEVKPAYLWGFPWKIYLLGKYLVKTGKKINLEGIITTAENLYDYQRKLIEETFGVPVFNQYGCNDGGLTAMECREHEGLHHFMEWSIVEIINGAIVTTDLWNKAQPFIRYVNGDRAIKINERCACGRELELYEIKGRDNELIITPKKVIVPYYLLESMIYQWLKLNTVQYIQKPGYILEINIVKDKDFNAEDLRNLRKNIEKLCEGMKIHINFVKRIIPTKAGKTRFIINEDKELLKKYYGN